MTIYTKRGRDVFAPTTSDGQLRSPVLGEAQTWANEVERSIDGAVAGRVDAANWASLAAIPGSRAGQPATSYGPDAGTHVDPVTGQTVPNTGNFVWSTSPAGWRRVGGLDAAIVLAWNTGAGTPNAVVATTDVAFDTAPGKALITVNFIAANTGAMTLALNGETPRPLVTNIGAAVPSEYVLPGMSLPVQIDLDGNYRLFGYGDPSAIQTSVEAIRDEVDALAQMAADVPQWAFEDKDALALFMPNMPPSFITIGNVYYKHSLTEPTHAGKAQDGDGNWYEIADLITIYAEEWGVSSTNADNTSAFDDIIAAAPANAEIIFPRGQTIAGHFISPNKVFDIDGNGSTLVNVDNDKALIWMGHGAPVEYAVTEATLARGATSFTVVGSSGLFAAGHIGYLWDSARRNSDDSPVNFETVKIKSIVGDVITVVGNLRSYKGAGAIKFYHKAAQHKGGAIRNFNALPNNTHNFLLFGIANCEAAVIEHMRATNSMGDAFSSRYCYDVTLLDHFCNRPRNTNPGGYGTQLWGCTKIAARKIGGVGTRHVLDLDNCYDFTLDTVWDDDCQSSICTYAHNGFASDGRISNVRGRSASPAVSGSTQAYGGSGAYPRATKANHPFFDIYVDGVDAVVPAAVSPNDTVGREWVSHQNAVSGVIRNVKVRFEDGATAVTSASATRAVQLGAPPCGPLLIENIEANRIGTLVIGMNDASLTASTNLITLRQLKSGQSRYAGWFRGGFAIDADQIEVGSLVSVNAATAPHIPQDTPCYIRMDTTNSAPPSQAFIGANFRTAGTEAARILAEAQVIGALAASSQSAGTNLPVASGQKITAPQVQSRNSRLGLVAPTGAGTLVMDATEALPRPNVNGATLLIETFPGRNDIQFPTGNNIDAGFTITAGGWAMLVASGGKWKKTGL